MLPPVPPPVAAIVVFVFFPGANSVEEIGGMPPISSSFPSSSFFPDWRETDELEELRLRKPVRSPAMSSMERYSGCPKLSEAVRSAQSTSKDWRKRLSQRSPSTGKSVAAPSLTTIDSFFKFPQRSARIAAARPVGTD